MDTFKQIQNILRYLFYILGVAAIIGFVMAEQGHPNSWWMYCGLGAIGCSLIRFILRFL